MPTRDLPYAVLFQEIVPNLNEPDEDGWATGDCPYCGDIGSFRANLKTGRWLCLPPTGRGASAEGALGQ
jgi:hypothetical protein